MANYTRSKSNKSKSTYGGISSYLFGSTGGNSWGRFGTTSTPKSKNHKKNSSTGSSSAYRTCCNNFEQKIASYKTLCAQTHGTGSWGKPSPTTLNSFANWINKGAIVQTCTPSQISRWARSTNKNFNPRNPSPTACKSILTAKFGRSCIKAVCITKNGQCMVATSPVVNGRSFCFPR
jgi:hypothetical protein